MSAERFGAVYVDNTNDGTWLLIAGGAIQFERSVVVNFCNQANYPNVVHLAYIGDPLLSGPETADIMMVRSLAAGETYIHPAIALSQTGRLVVKADYAGASIIAHGFQDPV